MKKQNVYLFHCRYKPPITSASTSPNLPDTPDEITEELRKQESLLSQIHAEMNAGFVSKKREEQLWEVSRIITQLKVSFISKAIVLISLFIRKIEGKKSEIKKLF